MKVENNSIYYEKNQVDKELNLERLTVEIKSKRRYTFFLVGTLMVISLINLYSVSDYEGKLFSLPMTLLFMFVGSTVGFFVSTLDYRKFNKNLFFRFIYFGSLGLLAFMVIAGRFFNGLGIVREINGAYGWIRIGGLGIQPAEILKLAFIITLSMVLAKAETLKEGVWVRIRNSFIVLIPFILLIIFQNDLGTAIHYMAIYMILLFFTNIKLKVVFSVIGGFGALGFGLLTFIYKYGEKIGGGYKARRIIMYVDGIINDGYTGNIDIGYQVAQSLLAFGNGGLFGVGYGNGVQKFSYLPEIHTDFIMALFGEEFGLFGVMLIVAMYLILYNISMNIAMTSKDYFGKYLVVGVAGMIITQVLINLFVAVGLLPVFGIPMPLFSYGGSSIITILTGIGIVLSVNNYTASK